MFASIAARRLGLGLLTLVFAAAPLPASSRDAQWLADIDHFAAELARLHVDAFARMSQESFSAQIEFLKGDVPALQDHEVKVRLLRIVTGIGDSHTALYGYEPAQVPIELYWFADGLFVVRAAETQRDLVGARLLAIDGRPVEEILTAVGAIVPHENDSWLRELAPRRLVAPEVLHALGIASGPSLATFRFSDATGAAFDRVLVAANPSSIVWAEGLAPDLLPLYRRNRQHHYWYEYVEASNTLYVAYNRCSEMASAPPEEFGSQLAAFASSHIVRRVVLDLRNNGGGNSGLIVPLFMPLFLALPEIDHPDRLFVVIGPATFSSAMMNAISIRDQTQATLAGSPTGGKPNHFGNVSVFTLPFSGLLVQYSTTWYTLIRDGDPLSVVPDLEIPISSQHYFSGRDPVMERIAPSLPRRRSVRH